MYILTTLLIIHFYTAKAPLATENEVSHFEYGAHTLGEELSYVFTSTIPPFQPIFNLNVTPQHEHLEKRFTYLKAEYINPVSIVEITFDPKSLILTIHQKFPFVSMPLGVHGYSMRIGHQN